ncbi:MAG: DUF4272 domain-containing protein, partial [Phototrophicaceae bacterium]
DTIAVFVPSNEIIPIEELQDLTTVNEWIILRDDNENIIGYRMIWDAVQLEMRFLDDHTQQAKIDQFLATAEDLLDKRKDKKASKVLRRAERMEQYIACEVTPDWDDDRQAQLLVEGLMAYYDYALMFAHGAIYNDNGNIEVGKEGSKPKYWVELVEKDKSEVPNERKKQSLQILNREKVPFIKHLRNIPEDEFFTLRTEEEIIKRAIVLNLISRRADGKSREWLLEKLEQYQLSDVLTDEEAIFNEDTEPEQYISIMFSQRLEASWLLLWALRLVPDLVRPDTFADAALANEIIDTRSIDQFLIESQLRSKSEILDMLDLHFRYHWAVVDAELYGKKSPTGLKPDVVYQRHYALNWVTQLRDQDWDAITTDT